MYELFEHTADLGLRVHAPSLNQLFEEAACCLFSAVVEDLTTVAPDRRVDIALEGSNLDYLLFDWLQALLYHFDTDHLLFSRFDVQISDTKLQGSAWGEVLDRSKHRLEHEVKAITYHGLCVEQAGDLWKAEVIVDI